MNRAIVVGSPRVDGRSASLADELFNACIEECPDDGVSIVSVASTSILPCTGCDACAREQQQASAALEEGDPLSPHPAVAESDAAFHQCVLDDDMPEVRKHLDAADELIVVSPVYFASVPAQFKCLLDRLQPYYRSNLRSLVKRPMVLHVVGEGGDPHGFDPLIGTVVSAFSVAGFQLESVFDWVGKIDVNGEFTGEPVEYVYAPALGSAASVHGAAAGFEHEEASFGNAEELPCEKTLGYEGRFDRGNGRVSTSREGGARSKDGKPLLSLSQPQGKGRGGARSDAKAHGSGNRSGSSSRYQGTRRSDSPSGKRRGQSKNAPRASRDRKGSGGNRNRQGKGGGRRG